jgi:hypothetical protein
VTPIKASLAFVQAPPDNLYTFGTAIYAGMDNNSAYPSPPIDMPTFKATLDGYQTPGRSGLGWEPESSQSTQPSGESSD